MQTISVSYSAREEGSEKETKMGVHHENGMRTQGRMCWINWPCLRNWVCSQEAYNILLLIDSEVPLTGSVPVG